MPWDSDKSTAADPDNPNADEQLTADEWDAHVTEGHFPADELNLGVNGSGDPVITDPQNGDAVVLRYDRSAGQWVLPALSTDRAVLPDQASAPSQEADARVLYAKDSDGSIYKVNPDGSEERLGGSGALSDSGTDHDGGDDYQLPNAADNIDLQSDGEIRNAEAVSAGQIDNDDYHEKVVTQSGSTGSLDLSSANVFEQTVTGNISFSFNNPSATPAGNSFLLVVIQDGTGGHTLSWPAAVEWDGGSAPGVSTAANDKHIFSFVSPDGGTTWYGFVAAENVA